jgi:hypothetical protein
MIFLLLLLGILLIFNLLPIEKMMFYYSKKTYIPESTPLSYHQEDGGNPH